MKKVVLSAVAVGVAALLGTVGYVHLYDVRQSEALTVATHLEGTERAVAKVLYDNGCQYCHTQDPQLPFYAQFPLVKDVVRKDNERGVRVFRLDDIIKGLHDPSQVSEVALAKLERVVINNEMPLVSFTAIHWASTLDDREKSILLNYTRKAREQFLPKNLAGVDPHRLVQPLPYRLKTNPAEVALGKILYHDTRLSGDNTVSCASCHQLDKGGVDGLVFSVGIGGQEGGINAPTVFNAAFNIKQFWDGRAHSLADQAGGPPFNPIEMGSKDWDEIIGKLKQDKEFTEQFLAVYPKMSGDTITHAIGEFEKTLITPDSRFDRYLKGDESALNDEQKRGFMLFTTHKCDTCHTGVALGGQSFEYMGLYDDYFAHRGTPITDADLGRFAVTGDEGDRHKFKVPTLRNVALTAPYFHDGSVKSLKEAVHLMLHYQVGKDLSDAEVSAITAFLHTLTGKLEGQSLDPSSKTTP